MRTIVVVLALACMGSRVAPASALVMGALTFGLHTDDHAHSVTLVMDEHHVDIVVTHPGPGDDASHPHEETLASESDDTHVFHLIQDDAATTTPRRDGFTAPHVVTLCEAYAPRAAWAYRRVSPVTPHFHVLHPLKTVVLRV